MIQYSEYPPSTFLHPFVECIWSLRTDGNFFKKPELIIPGGRVEMIFNLGSTHHWIDSCHPDSTQTCIGSFMMGPRNRPFFLVERGCIHTVGVRFRHGGLTSFTKMPMNILLNEIVPLDVVFGSDVNTLTQQLFGTDKTQYISLIESFLTKRFQAHSDERQTVHLISIIKQGDSLSSEKSLSEKTGIHYKKLERVFAQHTGYSPKNFSRVLRFYKTIQQIKRSRSSLTTIGLNGGYYDQPHFIRDFKAFTGTSPTQFHAAHHTIANLLLESLHV